MERFSFADLHSHSHEGGKLNDVPGEISIVVRTCPMCGKPVEVDDRLCASCGESLDERPKEKLHGLGSAVWAAIFGGLAGTGIVLAINYRRWGRTAAAWCVAVIGIGLTVVIIFGLEKVAGQAPNLCLGFFQIIFAYLIANALQGTRIRNHIRKGGQTASAWQGVGIGVLSTVVLVGFVVGVEYVNESYSQPAERVIKFNKNDDIRYSGEATTDDARKLAKFLKEAEIFGGDGASVRLEATSGEYTVSFVLSDGAWNDPEIVAVYRDLGREMTESLFPPPLTVRLCDRMFEVRESVVVW